MDPAFLAAINNCGIVWNRRRRCAWPPALARQVAEAATLGRRVALTPLQRCRLGSIAAVLGYTGRLFVCEQTAERAA